jgi:hypothetical protein
VICETLFQFIDQCNRAGELLRVVSSVLTNALLEIGKERFLVPVASSNFGPFCPPQQISQS